MKKETVSILIIEDDKFFRDLISKKLIKENFDVLTAVGSKDAFEILKEKIPSLIILDLVLLGVSGYEILSILKKDEATKNIPVIILSNLGQEEEIERAKSLGADDFLIKVNFTLEEIVEKIKTILRNKYL